MRKLLALILTISMLATSVVPVYASTTDANAKKLLLETSVNTITQINNEYYSDGYLENYNETMNKLLTNLMDTSKFSYNATFTSSTDDESQDVGLKFDYNDDGSSLLIDFTLIAPMITTGGEPLNGTLYIDDTKLVVNFSEISLQPIVYNFGDSLNGTYLEGADFSYFKYSNIKKYSNQLLELQTSGKLDAIKKDYLNNLLLYIGEAEFSNTNNTVTMVIDADLIREYFNQLGTKIKNDKNIKGVYESLEIGYPYEDFTDGVEYNLQHLAKDISNNSLIEYTGVIENNVFARNNLSFTFNDFNSTTIELNFNDVSKGILSEGELLLNDDYESLDLFVDFSLTKNNNENIFKYSAYTSDILVSEGNIKYTLDGLSSTSLGEVTTYSTPYFHVTEKPVLELQTFEEWYAQEVKFYTENIEFRTHNLMFAEKYIANIENSITETTSLALEDKAYSDFLLYTDYYYLGDYVLDEVINSTDGEVINKEAALEMLYGYVDYINYDLEYDIEQKEETEKNAKELYQEYVNMIKEFYDYELEEYNTYVEYMAQGTPSNILKQIIEATSVLTEERFTSKQNQQMYENDKLQMTSTIESELGKSTTKNTINTSGAVKFADILNKLVETYY